MGFTDFIRWVLGIPTPSPQTQRKLADQTLAVEQVKQAQREAEVETDRRVRAMIAEVHSLRQRVARQEP